MFANKKSVCFRFPLFCKNAQFCLSEANTKLKKNNKIIVNRVQFSRAMNRHKSNCETFAI